MRVALYARISTDGKGQDPLNQLLQLRKYAARQGWRVVREYTDVATGKDGDRAALQEMLRDAARHRFDTLLFWSLDRLTREGTFRTLCYLRQLSDAGIKYRSHTEPYLDTLGVWGEAIAGVLAALAAQERTRIAERTRAGLQRARAKGIKLGRPRLQVDVRRMRALRAQGLTLRQIGRKMRCSPALVCRELAG